MYQCYINNLDETAVLPGVRRILETLNERQIPIALGSASKNASAILTKTALLPYFNSIVDGNMVSEAKPDPEVFLKGAQLLGVEPECCLVFEDSQAGIEAANKAKMVAVCIGQTDQLQGAVTVLPDLTMFEVSQFFKHDEMV
ncbi:HAD family hydrolase [Brochothrix campestris]|uniref:Putative phosphatase/phosphohexomutase n=1 Tax=Brochothrix campestris FSL F6-1037 TaxID=1265861 RepID=W7CWK7_9LIST|nr:HAD-IA family hydrolase [Brochothrix campestris]EUJ41130.1 putative phosphatase/phosphohexomutase [Brochothrix campestris FSL F6-1037]